MAQDHPRGRHLPSGDQGRRRAIAEALAPALADGWHLASADPHLKGRNGVAVMSRHAITRTLIGPHANEFTAHGRYLEVDTGDLTVGECVLPDG